jgi:hypothetical protein
VLRFKFVATFLAPHSDVEYLRLFCAHTMGRKEDLAYAKGDTYERDRRR